MRCKQGDLAIIVKSFAGNEGKIVRCVKFLGEKHQRWPDGQLRPAFCWEVDTILLCWAGEPTSVVADEQLRPIGNPSDDAMDQMIVRVGKPNSRREKSHA